jgi:predicted transcriptional regulator
MDNIKGDISRMIFKLVERDDLGGVSLDIKTLKIVAELDGKKNISDIARKLNMDLGTIRKMVSKLAELNLIEESEEAQPLLDDEFLEYLMKQLFEATGPIAGALLEDVADELGTSVKKIPYYRAAELVDLLSREIPDEEKELVFKKAMLNKLFEKGY